MLFNLRVDLDETAPHVYCTRCRTLHHPRWHEDEWREELWTQATRAREKGDLARFEALKIVGNNESRKPKL
jgi:hypothetical protein